MRKEDTVDIKCDLCGVVVDLYLIPDVGWRCPPCIWKERQQLFELCEEVLRVDVKLGILLNIGSILAKMR